MNFINIIGLAMAVALLVPWTRTLRADAPALSRRENVFRVIALSGWYAGLVLLSFNFGILELDADKSNAETYAELFWIWAAAAGALAVLYLVFSLVGQKRNRKGLLTAAAVLPFPLFLLSGLLLGHLLFFPAAVLYAVGNLPAFFHGASRRGEDRPGDHNENTETEKEPK